MAIVDIGITNPVLVTVEGVAGDCMLPLLLPVVLSGVSTGITIGYTAIDLYHKNARARENERWWNDYFKNTGLSAKDIRYPYKAGFMDSHLADIQNAYAGYQFVSSNLGKLYR